MSNLIKKIFSVFTLLLIPVSAMAECPDQQELDIQTMVDVDGVTAGGDHGYMDMVTISVPVSVAGVPFDSIQLTYGEVSEYWLPLATKRDDNRVVATLSGYPDSIIVFDFWVNYSDGECALYQAGSIAGAYSNQVQSTLGSGSVD